MLDVGNTIFEIGGALFLLLNLRQLRIDREVKGIDVRAVWWFAAWGVWNVLFYAALGAPVSSICSVAVTAVNAAWLGHVYYYRAVSQRLIHMPPAASPEQIAT